jgi:hypothetical protein
MTPQPLQNIREFVFAGNAIFTIENTTTGNRFTYKTQQCEDDASLWFVKVLTGPDNESSYQYLGIIRGSITGGLYTHGRKSRIGVDAPAAVAFAWFWQRQDQLPASIAVCHEGHCGRCGRLLSVPDSIRTGFGPECIKLIVMPKIDAIRRREQEPQRSTF